MAESIKTVKVCHGGSLLPGLGEGETCGYLLPNGRCERCHGDRHCDVIDMVPLRKAVWRRMGTYSQPGGVFITGFQCSNCGNKFFTPEFDDTLKGNESTPEWCYCGCKMEKYKG